MPKNKNPKRDGSEGVAAAPHRPYDRVTMALMLTAAAAAVVGLGAIFSAWWGVAPPDPNETLEIASRQYVEGNLVLAGELAQTVQIADAKELQAQRDFLMAVGYVARANESELPRAKRQWLARALPILERVASSGFPLGREVEGNRYLGEAYYRLGEFDKAVGVLKQAIDRDPTLRRSLLPMLAMSQLNSTQPSAGLALSTIDLYLADQTQGEAARHEGELIRLDALGQLGRYEDAEELAHAMLKRPIVIRSQSVVHAPDYAEQIKLARGVARIRRSIQRYGREPSETREDRSAVISELADTMADLEDVFREGLPDTVARAQLWAARALICQGLFDQALIQMTAVRQQRPFGAEAIIGGLEEVELLAKLNRGVEMLQTLRFLIREIGDPNGFDPGLVSLKDFRRRIIVALETVRLHGDYEAAIDMSRTLTPVFIPSEALMQEGMAYQDWALRTLEEGTTNGGDVSPTASKLARQRFRAAGDAFARAAELDFDTERYLQTQWSAIDAYQQGRHFERSIRLLRPYLRYEERRRQPRGLVAFGRALLADNKAAEAIESLETCVAEYERDPLRYDARLLLAMAYGEQGNLPMARQYLIDNLQDGELTPQSPAWRDSLFTLAELLYQKAYENHLKAEHADPAERMELLKNNQAILVAAIRRLDEAAERYWPLRRAESAAYLAARSHVLAAEWPRLESKMPDILDAARRSLRNRVNTELELALDGFRNLKDKLLIREDERTLADDSTAMLRNCFLSEADTLKELEQYEEAATAYRTVALRYMNEPPALEAILGQISCARALGRSHEADLMIRQAEVVLQRIPRSFNDQFAKTTRYDRQGWEQLIAWMKSGIQTTDGITNQT
ncbi:tetratricopeptide repeat protein [Novipirellula aureliae]|nr:tetratricopeptide repeat protein [Novipirellula aureliae]